MVTMKNSAPQKIVAAALTLAFCGSADGDPETNNTPVCQATGLPGQYQVFYPRSGAVLGTMQVVPQHGAKEPFGSIKVHPLLGPRGEDDIMIIKPESHACEIHLREFGGNGSFKVHEFALLEGQKKKTPDLKVPFAGITP